MKTIAYIAVSLDGYIADRNGSVDWLNELPNPDQSDYGFADFMQEVGAIVMGSNTFKTVQSFGAWPYEKPVFVASNSITRVPAGYEDRITLVQGSIQDILRSVWTAGHGAIYVDGGKIIQGCLQEGLLDEMILTHIPIALGGGVPLFPELDVPVAFDHVGTETVGAGCVKSRYRVRRDS